MAPRIFYWFYFSAVKSTFSHMLHLLQYSIQRCPGLCLLVATHPGTWGTGINFFFSSVIMSNKQHFFMWLWCCSKTFSNTKTIPGKYLMTEWIVNWPWVQFWVCVSPPTVNENHQNNAHQAAVCGWRYDTSDKSFFFPDILRGKKVVTSSRNLVDLTKTLRKDLQKHISTHENLPEYWFEVQLRFNWSDWWKQPIKKNPQRSFVCSTILTFGRMVHLSEGPLGW